MLGRSASDFTRQGGHYAIANRCWVCVVRGAFDRIMREHERGADIPIPLRPAPAHLNRTLSQRLMLLRKLHEQVLKGSQAIRQVDLRAGFGVAAVGGKAAEKLEPKEVAELIRMSPRPMEVVFRFVVVLVVGAVFVTDAYVCVRVSVFFFCVCVLVMVVVRRYCRCCLLLQSVRHLATKIPPLRCYPCL